MEAELRKADWSKDPDVKIHEGNFCNREGFPS
jgi:hypothetical protein